jgi:hypothetical protein
MALAPNETIVLRGEYLYGGGVACDIRIVRTDVRYGTGDHEDPDEIRPDRGGVFYDIHYGSTTSRGQYNCGARGFESLEKAKLHAESAVVVLKWLPQGDPDFYLASSEGYGLEQPRRCHIVRALASEHRRKLFLVRVEPPIIGQPFGLGSKDIELVVLATRHGGASIQPPSSWPISVHVARLLSDAIGETIRTDQMESIAWGELYPAEEEAALKRM